MVLLYRSTHGYNTRDYRKIDVRLGTNEDFKEVCDALHAAGIRVVLDGVFNHVGAVLKFRQQLAECLCGRVFQREHGQLGAGLRKFGAAHGPPLG